MKRLKSLVFLIIAFLSIISLPTSAYAGDLSTWGNYFTVSRASGSNHFAFWKLSSGKYPHLNSTTMKYKIETSAVTTSMVNQATAQWGGIISSQNVSSGHNTIIKFNNDPGMVAYASTHGSINSSTGHFTEAIITIYRIGRS